MVLASNKGVQNGGKKQRRANSKRNLSIPKDIDNNNNCKSSASPCNAGQRRQSAVTVSSMPSLASFETEDADGGIDREVPLNDDNNSSIGKKGRGRIKRVVRQDSDSDLSQDSTIDDSVGSLGNLKELAKKKREEKEMLKTKEGKKGKRLTSSDTPKKSKIPVRHKSTGSAPSAVTRSSSQKPERQLSVSSLTSRRSKSPKRDLIKRDQNLPYRKAKSERDLFAESHQPQRDATSLSPRVPSQQQQQQRRVRRGQKKEHLLNQFTQSDHSPKKIVPRSSPQKSPKGFRPSSSAEMSSSFSPRRSKSLMGIGREVPATCSPRKSKSLVGRAATSIDENSVCKEPEISLESILGSHSASNLPLGASSNSIQSEPYVRRMPKGGSAIHFSRKTKISRKPDSHRVNESGDENRIDGKKPSRKKKDKKQESIEGRHAAVDAGMRISSSQDASEASRSLNHSGSTRPTFTKAASDRFLDMSNSINDFPPQIGSRPEPGSEASLHQQAMAAESVQELMRRGRLGSQNRMRAVSHSPSRGRRRKKDDVVEFVSSGDNDNMGMDKPEANKLDAGVTARLKPKKKKEKASKSRKLQLGSAKQNAFDVTSSDDRDSATFSSPKQKESTKSLVISSNNNLMSEKDAKESKEGKRNSKWGGSALAASIQIDNAWNTDTDNSDTENSAEEFKVQKSNKQLTGDEDPNEVVQKSIRKVEIARGGGGEEVATPAANKGKSRWTTARSDNDIQAAKRKLTVDEFLADNRESNRSHVEAPQIVVGDFMEDLSPVTTQFDGQYEKQKGKKKAGKRPSSAPRL